MASGWAAHLTGRPRLPTPARRSLRTGFSRDACWWSNCASPHNGRGEAPVGRHDGETWPGTIAAGAAAFPSHLLPHPSLVRLSPSCWLFTLLTPTPNHPLFFFFFFSFPLSPLCKHPPSSSSSTTPSQSYTRPLPLTSYIASNTTN